MAVRASRRSVCARRAVMAAIHLSAEPGGAELQAVVQCSIVQRVRQMAESAKAGCVISRALAVPVSLHATLNA